MIKSEREKTSIPVKDNPANATSLANFKRHTKIVTELTSRISNSVEIKKSLE